MVPSPAARSASERIFPLIKIWWVRACYVVGGRTSNTGVARKQHIQECGTLRATTIAILSTLPSCLLVNRHMSIPITSVSAIACVPRHFVYNISLSHIHLLNNTTSPDPDSVNECDESSNVNVRRACCLTMFTLNICMMHECMRDMMLSNLKSVTAAGRPLNTVYCTPYFRLQARPCTIHAPFQGDATEAPYNSWYSFFTHIVLPFASRTPTILSSQHFLFSF
jgi:hypothetical protein